ncbi:chloride channel protein [Roseomonas aerophila]|uniref:Chloride channel protein n=1 Tax=Teichococcus aerophilus TaxID=1224513 RepID=A0ABR7RN58_9PROT|nr:chloride channel protein [Pseudoroseomonas aerophila]
MRRLRRLPLLSPRQWRRRLIFWLGAVLVGLVAVAFAWLADGAQHLFLRAVSYEPLLVFILAPAGLALSLALTRWFFPGAQGSGIPQVIAALHEPDPQRVGALLTLRIAAGKVLLTLLGLASGASIGREGPTVQVGASIMHALGRWQGLPRPETIRIMVLAGGAAGVAAAFNTPLAGLVFGIEELSHSLRVRTGSLTLTAVVIAGITAILAVGDYVYFGVSHATLDVGPGWLAVGLCGVAGGLLGGGFSSTLLHLPRAFPKVVSRFAARRPAAFAACCGLVIATIGWASGGTSYGTGYEQARMLVEGKAGLPDSFMVWKLLATVASYLSGIPGGIFAPSLSIGAGLGQWLSALVPHAPAAAVVLLGMVGYFAGVVQAPITAAVIVMEMTGNHALMVPLMATSLLAFLVSRLVCRRPLYSSLAKRFLGH